MMDENATRLAYLATLRDGWLDGDGKAIGREAIARAGDLLRALPEHWKTYVYPTPDGGVQIEFNHGGRAGRPSSDWLIEIEIDWGGSAWGFASQYERTDEKLFGLGRTEDPRKLVAWLREFAPATRRPTLAECMGVPERWQALACLYAMLELQPLPWARRWAEMASRAILSRRSRYVLSGLARGAIDEGEMAGGADRAICRLIAWELACELVKRRKREAGR